MSHSSACTLRGRSRQISHTLFPSCRPLNTLAHPPSLLQPEHQDPNTLRSCIIAAYQRMIAAILAQYAAAGPATIRAPPHLAGCLQAMLRYDAGSQHVQLVSDRAYEAGQDVLAWCGPQPNRRLLINYGFVDENNPHDRVALTVRAGL